MNMAINDRFDKMPWDEIDNVVFDVGNVLIHFEPLQMMKELLPGLSDDMYRLLMQKTVHSPYWVAMDHGSMSYDDIIQAMIGLDKHLTDEITTFMRGWYPLMKQKDEGVRALKLCKEKGKKLYVLSNFSDMPFDYTEENNAFFSLFDDKVVSSRVHLLKPDPEIYRYLVRSFELDPARTLFIDDNPANIETALMEGWQGFCFLAPGILDKYISAN